MKIRKGTGVQYLAPKIIEPPLQSHRKSRGGGGVSIFCSHHYNEPPIQKARN